VLCALARVEAQPKAIAAATFPICESEIDFGVACSLIPFSSPNKKVRLLRTFLLEMA
jgi:hypothetical protein